MWYLWGSKLVTLYKRPEKVPLPLPPCEVSMNQKASSNLTPNLLVPNLRLLKLQNSEK